MLVITCNKEVLEKSRLYDKMFAYYRDEIVNTFLTQWKDEDINGDSCHQLLATKYFLAFLYILLLYCERKEALKTDGELIDKYEISKMQECFGCDKISIKKLLEIAEIELVRELPCDGINGLQDHVNVGIGEKNCITHEQEDTTTSVNLIPSILAANGTKTILLPSNC